MTNASIPLSPERAYYPNSAHAERKAARKQADTARKQTQAQQRKTPCPER